MQIEALGDFACGPIPGVEFTKLVSSDRALPLPPRFIFGTFPAQQTRNYYTARHIGSIGIFSLRKFNLSGVFLLQSGQTYYRCPELNIHEAHIQEETKRISASIKSSVPKRLRGRYVLLSGPGHYVYGHWLVEYLPKFSLLKFAGYNIYDLHYLLPQTTPSFVLKWLELIGISGDQLVFYDATKDVINAEELIAPTILHNGVRMSPLFKDATSFLRSLVESKHDLPLISSGSRLFLARPKGSQTRALTNRAQVEEIICNSGFTLIYPEQLSLQDQLSLFTNAREIVGEYGSALHGSMFSPEGTVVCALRGTGNHPGFIQSGIAAALNQPTGYIFGESDETEFHFGFRIDNETLSTALQAVFSSGTLL